MNEDEAVKRTAEAKKLPPVHSIDFIDGDRVETFRCKGFQIHVEDDSDGSSLVVAAMFLGDTGLYAAFSPEEAEDIAENLLRAARQCRQTTEEQVP